MKKSIVRYKVPTPEQLDAIAKRQLEKKLLPFDYEGWMHFYIQGRKGDILESEEILKKEKERIKRAKSCIQVAEKLLENRKK